MELIVARRPYVAAMTSDRRPLVWKMTGNARNDGLFWLPAREDWNSVVRARVRESTLDWPTLVDLASCRLDFTMTLMLDRALRTAFGTAPPPDLATRPVRLAILGSATVDHLLPGIRVGALRRGIWVDTYVAEFGQYMQELADPSSPLAAFRPTCILLALDGNHLVGELDAAASKDAADAVVERALERCTALWTMARRDFDCRVIQQTPVPVFVPLLGHNEQRLPGSKARALARVAQRLRDASDEHRVDLLAIDDLVGRQGLDAWYDPALWFKAKHEIRASAGALYGDHVARLLAAQQGRSAKCLVLDLDNTLWGGVIGDDGLDGIVLGQGSAVGEAYVALQSHARELSRRGVILAVCSKNDEANALLPFEAHPDMILKREDIACFVANWDDKATNLRRIAAELNIGLDSLVFVDDNPFERNIVRATLPEVAVPELHKDPSTYLETLVAAGYFESIAITAEDAARTAQYRANAQRHLARAAATDLDGYLRELDMELHWARFDRVGLVRIAQLINKTNQFNLTTRRTTEDEISDLVSQDECLTLQLRLKDRLGDNGIIAIVIARPRGSILHIDTWLMSCRVLGRKVEQATLNLIMREAGRLGATRVVGEYIATAKNGMVSGHYASLGFARVDSTQNDWFRDVDGFEPAAVPMKLIEQRENVSA
jgi:FkbH-like protein